MQPPRYIPENPFDYTPDELRERKKALRDLARDYPDLPFAWLEMVYDFHKNTSAEKVSEIIKCKTWETPGRFTPSL